LIVIDASTVISAALEDENTPSADPALDYVAENGGVIPGNFFTEVVNALAKAERRGRIDSVKADIILSEILSLPLSVEMPDPHAVLVAARVHQLTAYDAAYLALAIQVEIPLATVDEKLSKAAKAAKCAWKPRR